MVKKTGLIILIQLLFSFFLYAQKEIRFETNTGLPALQKQFNYPLLKSFDNSNYFSIGFSNMYGESRIILFTYNDSFFKIRDLYFLEGKFNRQTLTIDYITRKHKTTRAERKQWHKLIASINWNRYGHAFDSTYFCENKNLPDFEFQDARTIAVQTDDGFSFSIVLHQPKKIRSLHFYEWPEFLKICSDKSHHTVQEIFEKSKKYMTLKN